jgi:hypothetical protein
MKGITRNEKEVYIIYWRRREERVEQSIVQIATREIIMQSHAHSEHSTDTCNTAQI